MVKIERWPHLSNLSNLSNREMVTTPGSKQRRHDTVNRLSSTKSLLLLSLSAFSQLEEEDRRGELNRKEDAALCLRGADCTDMPLSPPSLPKMSKSSTDMPAALLPWEQQHRQKSEPGHGSCTRSTKNPSNNPACHISNLPLCRNDGGLSDKEDILDQKTGSED